MKLPRKLNNLFIALTFIVVVITGLLAFFLPFSIQIIGSHALMGLLFVFFIAFHIHHNFQGLRLSFKAHYTVIAIALTTLSTAIFLWQPAPIQKILGLSRNLGPALDRFEMQEDGLVYQYTPAENYKLKVDVKLGKTYNPSQPPAFAIWLENQSRYHIKTLFTSDDHQDLPLWAWKVKEYEEAKKELENNPESVDALTQATPNASFDPRDYILPERNKEAFYMVIEVNQKKDKNEFYPDQPSLIYRVEIDNQYPKFYQVFDLMGYSKKDGDEILAYFPDHKLTTALHLIDSALLTIER